MRVLLMTISARGHAIADALSRSPQKPEIIALSPIENPAIKMLAKEFHQVETLLDFEDVRQIVAATKPDFAVIGPEEPLVGGIADLLATLGVPTVGPKKNHAQLEGSKGFTRHLLQKYNIDASPKFEVFLKTDFGPLNKFIEQDLRAQYVVKYDGLKGGKGVKIGGEHLQTVDEGVQYAVQCIREHGQVVIEQKLTGVEFSLMSFVSGETVVDMPLVQDHKRAFEDDTGPNTGGMGTVTDADHSLPFLAPEDLARAKEINRAVAKAVMQEFGEPFMGILYGGYMAVRDGVKLIEFNVRFGDPEALNVLSILESDFAGICTGIVGGTLAEDMVKFADKATVCKYVVPKSYPVAKDEEDMAVLFPSTVPDNVRVYFGDITRDPDDGSFRLGGSRAAGIVGIGDTIEQAERAAQTYCRLIRGPVRFRNDIGTKALLQQRIDLMRKIRS